MGCLLNITDDHENCRCLFSLVIHKTCLSTYVTIDNQNLVYEGRVVGKSCTILPTDKLSVTSRANKFPIRAKYSDKLDRQ